MMQQGHVRYVLSDKECKIFLVDSLYDTESIYLACKFSSYADANTYRKHQQLERKKKFNTILVCEYTASYYSVGNRG